VRKRSKYRAKPVLLNPLGYVIGGMAPVVAHDTYLVDLKIKNHGAMTQLTRGLATREDVDVLIPMGNMCEALYRMGFGTEYADVVQQGLDALFEVARRGMGAGKFILRSQEMTALNALMELHDAQMGVITVKDMDRAIALVKQEHAHKRVRRIVEATQGAIK